jgi:NAD(P)-dependent dehydrogenase (short-subunit alcohol dehydrogenase family)
VWPLKAKAALVTGASRGIGKVIALSLAEAGADLLLAAPSMDDLQRSGDEAAAHGARAENDLPKITPIGGLAWTSSNWKRRSARM